MSIWNVDYNYLLNMFFLSKAEFAVKAVVARAGVVRVEARGEAAARGAHIRVPLASS